MIFLQDTLFGFRYSKEVFAAVPKTQGLGVFLELDIGTGYRFAEDAGKRGYPIFRAHPMWKDRHDFGDKDLPAIIKAAKRYDAIAAKYPKTKWYLSTGCEHKLSSTLAQKYYDQVKAAAPHCTIVNCPLPEGAVLNGVINEFHGKAKKRSSSFAYSADGESLVDMNCTLVKEQFAGAEYFGIWDPQYNQRAETDDKTQRPKRRIKPSTDLIKSLVTLARDKGPTSLAKKWLYKSHSEKQLHADSRADKPVFIIPPKASKVELKRGGKVIATANYYGTYNDGRYRYYFKSYGYRFGLCDVYVNGKKQGTIDGAFRDGEFR